MAKNKKRSTPEKRTLILWALLVRENASSFQNELKPEPDKADRDALQEAGLIKAEPRGRYRRIWIEVTDKGWAWAGSNLGAALPRNSSAGCQILQEWLTRLKVFMEARGLALADVLGPQASTQAVGGLKAEPPRPAGRDYAAVRARIRKAYLDITDGRLNVRAPLSDIRQKLKDIDRAALDNALGRMHLEEGTTLSGLNNPQEITPAIRDAAVNFKGESMYVLWITK
jgi:hypothetical protein